MLLRLLWEPSLAEQGGIGDCAIPREVSDAYLDIAGANRLFREPVVAGLAGRTSSSAVLTLKTLPIET